MKQKLPEKYKFRSQLLKVSLEYGLSATTLDRMVKPMRGKTEEEKEQMAKELIESIVRKA